jgi:hypothetical protein
MEYKQTFPTQEALSEQINIFDFALRFYKYVALTKHQIRFVDVKIMRMASVSGQKYL